MQNILERVSVGILLLFAFLPAHLLGQAGNKSRPNVIVILADDMGDGDIARFNGGLNRTPVLDKLSQESVWFENAYSGSAVCAPARACLLTGRYPHRTGVTDLNNKLFPMLTNLALEEKTIADIFKANGYYTGVIGKWHLGADPGYHPTERGFDEFIGFTPSLFDNYYKYELDSNQTIKKYTTYLTDVLTEKAIGFVTKHKDQPFFLHLAHHAPHRPLGAPKSLVEYYQSKGFNLETSQVYAMVEVMDQGIGKLLEQLDKLGIRENTIVVFASDNGPDPMVSTRFNQHLRGTKYQVYEGGIRVPVMFNWKGHLSPGKSMQLLHFMDMLPTLASLCGISLDKTITSRLDGNNLASVVSGKPDPGLNSVLAKKRYYWQWNRGVPYYSHNAALRDGDWKLVYQPVMRGIVDGPSTLPPLLFNLKDDPTESTDVSAKHPTEFKRMKSLLENWCRKMEFERLRNTLFDN